VRDPPYRGLAGRHLLAGDRRNTTSGQCQHRWRQFRGAVGDLTEVPCTGQHGEHHHCQHRADPMAHTSGLTWISHPAEHVHQRADTGDTCIRVTGRRATLIQDVRH
jgi:hypothetical protein